MPEGNANARLEAFSDGVFAIALTLLVIEIKLPSIESIGNTVELWGALRNLAPAVFAFVLSFVVVFITWVNHCRALKLMTGSSAAFIYANGFMLLTVVFIPFPTALLGAFISTDHAAPAVVLYDGVLAVQAIGWLLFTGAALKDHLLSDEEAISTTRHSKKSAYFAFALYSLLALTALWFPKASAIVTTATWSFWLALSIRMKQPE